MALADSELLISAQAADASAEVKSQFVDRFGGFLRYTAGRCCTVYKIDFSLINDVVNDAVAMVLDPDYARFCPSRGRGHLAYLHGLIQNATKQFARFVRRGEKRRHDWGALAVGVTDDQPASLEELPAPEEAIPGFELREIVDRVLGFAEADERQLLVRHFYQGESIEEIAISLGVARTTISRRLQRFYARAAAYLAA
jgi:RNA polymerase sigma factor (sigma-70 family)